MLHILLLVMITCAQTVSADFVSLCMLCLQRILFFRIYLSSLQVVSVNVCITFAYCSK